MNVESATSLCRSLPGATESTRWGKDLVFSVGDRMFAVTSLGEATGISFKVDDARFLDLTARAKWVYVENADASAKTCRSKTA